MRSTRNQPTLQTWTRLQSELGGSFTACRDIRGLITGELTLFHGDGRKLGWLKPRALEGAHLEVGGLAATFEHHPETGGYRMSGAGTELLSTGSGSSPELYGAGGTYETRVSLLRNSAAVRFGGYRVASLKGNLAGTRYEVALPVGEEPLALPAALFLLYYVPALRSRAYRAG